MSYWVEAKNWLAGLTPRRKLGMVFVLLFPAVALSAWVLEDSSPLRVAVALGGYAAIGAFYIWQEIRVMSKVLGQPRQSIAELWSEGNRAQRTRVVVFVFVAVALIVIGAISGFNEGRSSI